MEVLVCDACGGSLISDNSGEYFICEFCGTKHTKSRINEKVKELSISGPVETFSGNQDKENHFTIAERLLLSGNVVEANGYYKNLCGKYPDDYRAWWYYIKTSKELGSYDFSSLPSRGVWDFGSIAQSYLLTKEYRMALSLAPDEVKEEIILHQKKRNIIWDILMLKKELPFAENNIRNNDSAKRIAKTKKEEAQKQIDSLNSKKQAGWVAIIIGAIILFACFALNIGSGAAFLISAGIIAIGITILCNTNETYILSRYSADSKIDLSTYDKKDTEFNNELSSINQKISELETQLAELQ